MTNIELPKDADGREVPLDTTTLYDESGQPLKVRVFQYSPEFGKWLVRCWFNEAEMSSQVSKYHLEPTDSWEKLEGDELERTFCSEIRGTRYCKYEELY